MAILDELAAKLSGRSRAEENIVSTDATTRTYIGTATSDSSDGSVYVALSEDVTMPDDYDGEHGVGVEMPTTVGVSEGDDVVVTVFGGSTMKAPVVTGNPGWGDDVETRVTEAHDLAASVESIAQEAKEVAEATGQNFWSDSDGVHVTEVTQDEWGDSTSPNYHSGANVLLNALGQLFRDGLNNILAIVSGTDPGIAIYDGEGNAADNILALLTKSLIRLGGKFAASGQSTAKVQFFEDNSALTNLTAEHYIDKTIEPQVSHSLALSATTTDDELPAGTSRTVTGNVNVWEQIYHDGTNYSDEVTVSLNGSTTNRTSHVSMGVQAIQSNSLWQRVAFVVADTLRLTYGAGEQATVWSHAMSGVIRAITNADKANTWVTVSAANWVTMNSGYSVVASDLKYNAYQHRIIGSLQVRETTGHSAGNNVCGTVKSGYRPPARQIIHTTTNGAYKMFVDSGGGLALVLGSATSANTDHWFALDYIVNG